MTPTATITSASTNATLGDRATDAIRHVAHAAHEARLLKSLASDAVEDGVYTAKRAVTRGLHDLEDLRDAAAYRIKRAPFTSLGVAVAGGVLFGIAFGWFGRGAGSKPR